MTAPQTNHRMKLARLGHRFSQQGNLECPRHPHHLDISALTFLFRQFRNRRNSVAARHGPIELCQRRIPTRIPPFRETLSAVQSLCFFPPAHSQTGEGQPALNCARRLPRYSSPSRHISFKGSGRVDLHCGRRTSTSERARSGSKEITLPPAFSTLFQNVPHLLLFRS